MIVWDNVVSLMWCVSGYDVVSLMWCVSGDDVVSLIWCVSGDDAEPLMWCEEMMQCRRCGVRRLCSVIDMIERGT